MDEELEEELEEEDLLVNIIGQMIALTAVAEIYGRVLVAYHEDARSPILGNLVAYRDTFANNPDLDPPLIQGASEVFDNLIEMFERRKPN